MTTSTELKTIVATLDAELRELRHDLHRHPEMAFEEHRTSNKVRELLAQTQWQVREPFLETDVVADLDVGADTTVLLRADMDALPIQELSDVPYKSTVDGCMHACGHDGHTTIMVGVARALDKLKADLPVNVRLTFQPAEEMRCGGKDLVDKGACDGADAAFALHGWPKMPVGQVASRTGVLLAAGGEFRATLTGKGCHGAMPELGNNPLPAASEFVVKMQRYHQDIYEKWGAVLSSGAIRGGDAPTIIPETVTVMGTLRYLEEAQGDEIEAFIRNELAALAKRDELALSIDLHRSYHVPVRNAQEMVQRIQAASAQVNGDIPYYDIPDPCMANEDFAFYLVDRPGAMFCLGVGEDKPPLHHPTYDFNDEVIATGVEMFCALVLGWEHGLKP